MSSHLIRKATIIQPASRFHNQAVDILIGDGKIRQIGAGLDAGDAAVIEGDAICVSAGWVDAFADYREPGYEQKETIATGLEAAAAAGFTDVLLAPNTAPPVDDRGSVQHILSRAAGHAVSLRPLGALSKGIEGKALAEMLDMRAGGAIAFTDGWQPVQSAQLLLKALEYVKAFGGLVIQIPNDAALAAGGLMNEGPLSTRLGMPGTPVIAESLMVHRDIELLRYTGSRLHLTGISTAESVALIRKAKEDGLDITCSVTPYHLALTEAALSSYSSAYKVTPVLRAEEDRKALLDALLDGTIDCIATHHRPQDWDAKEKEFEYAGEGMAVQETALGILLESIGRVGMKLGLPRLAEALSEAPRRIFGLKNETIGESASMPLTVFSAAGITRIERAAAQSLAYNNPFLGKDLPGRVLGIFSNGTFKASAHG